MRKDRVLLESDEAEAEDLLTYDTNFSIRIGNRKFFESKRNKNPDF